MSHDQIQACVLTVSDRVSMGEAEDGSGPVITDILCSHLPCGISYREVVPDDLNVIQRVITRWADQARADLIVTTGGTGFAPRDRTPEAVRPLLDREAPGLVVAMLQASLQVTPHAMLSRPVAGMRGRTLIITLPGSPKACREMLSVVMPSLPHGLALLRDEPSAHLGHHLLPV